MGVVPLTYTRGSVAVYESCTRLHLLPGLDFVDYVASGRRPIFDFGPTSVQGRVALL